MSFPVRISVPIPLDEKTIYCVKSKTQVPVLSPNCLCDLCFVEYTPLSDNADTETVDKFIYRLELLRDDFEELLHMDFDQFWCQLLHSKSLRASLDSFLIQAPRDGLSSLPTRARSLYRQLLSLVFAVFIRASTPCENESDFFTPKAFAELLYSYFVFDIPKMMDLCAVFHGLCQPRLVLILSSVFTYQEKYFDDLRGLFDILFDVFNRVESQVPLPASGFSQLSDMMDYLSDISWSLYSFFSTLAQLTTKRPVAVCFDSSGLERFAAFFEHVFSSLQMQIEAAFHLSSNQREKLFSNLSWTLTIFIRAVREGFLEPYFLDRIRQLCEERPCLHDRLADDPAARLAQRYMDQMLHLLSYRKFSLAMHILYPLDKDVSSIRQLNGMGGLDDATSQYLLGAADCLLSEAGIHPTREIVSNEKNQVGTSCIHPLSVEPMPGPSVSKSVRDVREVLPHLDIELIKRYLSEFSGDPSRVINAALEGNLPENVIHQDEPTDLEQTEMDLATAAAVGVISLHSDQLWQGKRMAVLSDLGKREKRVTLRSAFSIWEDDDSYSAGSELPNGAFKKSETCFEDIYEDDYDDSYDIREGIVDKIDPNEQSESPSFTTNVVGTGRDNRTSSIDAVGDQPPTVLRIENPEIVRRRQEEFRLAHQGHRHRNMRPYQPRPVSVALQPVLSRSNVGSRSKIMSDDCAGSDTNPNQDESRTNGPDETYDSRLRNSKSGDRLYRGIHKARFGNHNRRRLADRKRQF